MKFKELAIAEVKPGNNIRTDFPKESLAGLMDSIQKQGILQPLLIKSVDGKFELVAGGRRFAAAKALKLEKVPCVIRDIDKKDVKQIQLVENIQRENLNPIDEAVALSDLLKVHKIDDLAMMIGKTPKYVSDREKILSLPLMVTDALKMKKLSVGHAIVISRLNNKKLQIEICREILSERMSVKQAESALSHYAKHLEYAPFGKQDCKNCVHNGTNFKDLFDKAASLKGECMNPDCFNKKLKEYIVARKQDWKNRKIPVISREQYYSSKENNKWHSISSYEISEVGKEALDEEMKKAENVAVMITDAAREEMLIKKSTWKVLSRRKSSSGKQGAVTDNEAKKQREAGRKRNRIDETKRRFLIERLKKEATAEQLDRVALEILFNSEHGTGQKIAEFFIAQGLMKKKADNFQVRWKINDYLPQVKHSAVLKEQLRVAKDYIESHDTDYLVVAGKEVKVDMSQFRMDEEYLAKHTKDSLIALVKELKLQKPDKFDGKSKKDMIAWILEQKVNRLPKELLK